MNLEVYSKIGDKAREDFDLLKNRLSFIQERTKNLEDDKNIQFDIEEKKEEAPNYLLQERKKNSFCLSFSFREAIVNEKTKASFVNGVLTIHLPKQEPEKPKKVKIDIA